MSQLLNKLKYETNKSTTEELFDIIPQEENQCLYINGLITSVDWGMNHIKNGLDDYTLDSMESALSDCRYEIENIPHELEKMRESIINIRAWGEEWKNLAKWALEQLPEETLYELVGLDLVNIKEVS